MNLAFADTGEIKSMHRLAIFHHDIVCYVNYIINRPHASVADPLLHPFRRGGNLHVFHHAGRIARAQVGILNDDFRHICNIALGFCLHNGLVQLQLFTEGYGRFSC